MDEENKKLVITTKDGKPLPIPPEGALGLLALGYKGLIAWRQARREYNQQRKAMKQEGQLQEEAQIDTDIHEGDKPLREPDTNNMG
ncbi:MAG: hypothetical protein ACKVPJ_05645 [Chitinophagales bacterium]